MQTEVLLDNAIIEKALEYSNDIMDKRSLIELALQEFITKRKAKNLKDIKGKIKFDELYNYKEMRVGNGLS